MDRKTFIANSLGFAVASLAGAARCTTAGEDTCASRLEAAEGERTFVNNWLDDLFDGIETEADDRMKVRLLEACGRGCYRRHPFKQEIARRGSGGLAQLEAAYRENFEAWREGETLHIRYGAVSKGCYCPAARRRAPRANDLHCECTKATHQAVCEAALGRPCRVEILETVRRGGRTCHFAVHPA